MQLNFIFTAYIYYGFRKDDAIQDFDTIVNSKNSLEMESLKICKGSLISMEIDTFDR